MIYKGLALYASPFSVCEGLDASEFNICMVNSVVFKGVAEDLPLPNGRTNSSAGRRAAGRVNACYKINRLRGSYENQL